MRATATAGFSPKLEQQKAQKNSSRELKSWRRNYPPKLQGAKCQRQLQNEGNYMVARVNYNAIINKAPSNWGPIIQSPLTLDSCFSPLQTQEGLNLAFSRVGSCIHRRESEVATASISGWRGLWVESPWGFEGLGAESSGGHTYPICTKGIQNKGS